MWEGGGGSMTPTHIETNRFGTCLVICAPIHTNTHTHTLTYAQALWGYPPFKPWLGEGGGCLSFSHMFFTGGREA